MIYCVYTKESLVYTQEISCACTTLLCMLWARDPMGQRPKEAAVQGLGPAQLPLWVPAGTQRGSWAGPGPWTAASLGLWPLGSLAQSMHKSVVHAQEISCVYT